jgi:RNA polymerase sigma factor (sigma-70 family)
LDPRWEQLYSKCRPQLYRAAAFLVGDAEGEEIVQDTFERAMKQERFFEEVREPVGWLRRVVVRLAVSSLRRRAVWERIHLLLRHEEHAPDSDLESALKTLPPSQRGAIVLRYYFGADYSEIATALSLRENSVSKTLTRARDSLRRELA